MQKKLLTLSLSTAFLLNTLLSSADSLPNNLKPTSINSNITTSLTVPTTKTEKPSSLKEESKYPFDTKTKEFLSKKIPPNFLNDLSTDQLIEVNLPAYRLTLYTKNENNEIENFTIPVAIGKGAYGRRQTPISVGIAYQKRKQVIFRYGKNYPQYNAKAGDIIKWTNTFDTQGNPIGYKIPNNKMRGIGMKLWESTERSPHERFVLHSTTDEFTLNTPASSGCLRIGMEDMLTLYEKFSPQTKSQEVENPVPIIINYNLVEFLPENRIILHSDIYDTKKDLYEEFQRATSGLSIPAERINQEQITAKLSQYAGELSAIKEDIIKKYNNPYPKNYQLEESKEKLHKIFTLEELLVN